MQITNKTWKQWTEMIMKDLRLFGSFCMAQFIVWRALRRTRKEPAHARLRLIH